MNGLAVVVAGVVGRCGGRTAADAAWLAAGKHGGQVGREFGGVVVGSAMDSVHLGEATFVLRHALTIRPPYRYRKGQSR